MVEAPGTAPGSTTIIPRTVYHHSLQAGDADLGAFARSIKPDMVSRMRDPGALPAGIRVDM